MIKHHIPLCLDSSDCECGRDLDDPIHQVRAMEIPQSPQRQDSLDHQMQDVYAAAVRLGCYAAADWINRAYGTNGGREGLSD